MLLNCRLCGKPIAEIKLPDFKKVEVNAIRRVLSGFGIEIKELQLFLNPTPELVAELCEPEHPAGCK